MKIIIDKGNEEKNNELNIGEKEVSERYIVTKRSSGTGKHFGTLCLGLIGGTFGGVLAAMIAMETMNIDSAQKGQNNATNSTVTSYNFATVENPVVAISKQVGPSVVGIKVTYKSQSFLGTTEANGEGSGMIYSQDGYIVTNYHVVEEAISDSSAKVTVMLSNGDTLDAKVVGGDSVTDIAVIKVEKTGLTAVEFGDSDAIEVGELAVAIGNPLGEEFAGSVTVGYISAVNRKITSGGTTYNLI